MDSYFPRVYDSILARKLESAGAVLIEGAKWCGKTTTAEQRATSVLYMQDPDALRQNMRLAEIRPSLLLEGTAPRLIDEWQVAPQLWDAVRFEVDHRRKRGQFILTGSAVPPSKQKRPLHTGTGRVARMRMRPMSLWESGESAGGVSLGNLFAGEDFPVARSELDIDRLAFLTCRGGWPGAIGVREGAALDQAFNYLDAVAEMDISAYDGVARSPVLARRIMRSYARFSAAQTQVSKISADVSEGGSVSDETVRSYLRALEGIFVIDDLPAWNPNLRSKAAIRTTPTRHFVDPSVAVAALGAGPGDLLRDLETFGLLFEGLCVRDLRAYADALDGSVSHYRDSSGLECDAVVHLRNGAYGLVEIKLGGDSLVEEGATVLRKLANTIDSKRMGSPAFLMVLTGVGEFSYPREDGVYVVPIGCLKD